MPRTVKKSNEDDGNKPEPVELELNLAFASTRDLVAEIMKRCDGAVVAYQLTDAMMEAEPHPDDAHRSQGGRWTATSYTGSIPLCVGLAEIMKQDLLKEWE